MAQETTLTRFADLVREAKTAFRADFRYSEAVARNAGTLQSKEAKRQKVRDEPDLRSPSAV